ncbi:MAG: DUF86 domain-containing protein, partial [Planctomycetota bacterium]
MNLKVVEDRLTIVSRCVVELRGLPASDLREFLSDRRNAASAESFLRRAIQALFDATRHILSMGFGLGALEYKEVARLAAEKGLVADPQLADRFGKIAGYRNRMTHYYDLVTPEELFEILRDRLGDLQAIANA